MPKKPEYTGLPDNFYFELNPEDFWCIKKSQTIEPNLDQPNKDCTFRPEVLR
jgi:hypothetical protein